MARSKSLFFILLLSLTFITSCGKSEEKINKPYETEELVFVERVRNLYADCFSIDRYENGCSIISVKDGNRYLIVPEGISVQNMDESIRIIQQPVENIYLAATSAMGLFDALDCGDMVRFSGTKAEDWYIDYAKNAMNSGQMLYAGKYREPDYEMLLSENCGLSIQSTMIGHSPEVKEKLEELGITVFVDYSSYEAHPLGRSEWIRVYGEIAGKPELADSCFSQQAEYIRDGYESTGKTAVYFYISSSGQAVTRKPGDYITKMIELAGGENVLESIGDKDSYSTVTMEMERFYTLAKDADFIIYNSAVDGELESVKQLIAKNSLLADFKAVRDGNVWCTTNNLFQETMKLGTVVSDFNTVFTGRESEQPPQFIYRLEE